MQVATSLVAGLMLGVGILHLLPHAWFELQSIDRAAGWMLSGFLVMFLIQRFFHFHHHDVPEGEPESEHPACTHEHDHDHVHDASHPHGPAPAGAASHEHSLAAHSARHLSWGGAALGLTLHTLIDGIALAAAVSAESHGGEHAGLLGFGTFLVVILHKPFDAMAISTLMAAGGWGRMSRHLVNALFALAIPAGVLLFHFGAAQFSEAGHLFLGSALAFAAGTFLCIASSDLLPELQFHAHDRGKLSVALGAGLLLAVLIGRFETTGHDRHEHPQPGTTPPAAAGAEHDHDHPH
jgi:zinc and cadmium transporter